MISRILVPYDFSELSERALTYAKELAQQFEAGVDVVYVVPNPYVRRPLPDLAVNLFEDLSEEARNRLDGVFPRADRDEFRGKAIVKVGDARTEIMDCARTEQADLIVMGTHGR